MTTYYRVLFDEEGVFGVARAIGVDKLFTLPDTGNVEGWQTLVLELLEGDFADYLACNLGCRLCSDRLKRVLQDQAAPEDNLQWLPVEVRRGNETHCYSILHFPNPSDVLDKDKSIFVGEFVVKPVLSKPLLGGHQVFSFPKGGELPLFVSDQVKRAIEDAGCTGMELSRAAAH